MVNPPPNSDLGVSDFLEKLLCAISSILGPDDMIHFEWIFYEEEFKEVVFSLGPFKSLGPNYISPFFFQEYWDIVGHDVILVPREFLTSTSILKEIYNTYIVLIPKKSGTNKMIDFKPISLCNTLYKKFHKPLVNRIKTYFGRITNEH